MQIAPTGQVVPIRQPGVYVVKPSVGLKQYAQVLAASGAIIYAAYSVYRQKVVTFEELAQSAKSAVAWIVRRDANEQEILKVLEVLRKEREQERREREQERRENKTMAERLKAMSRALDVCMSQRQRQSSTERKTPDRETPRPQKEADWSWDVYRGPQRLLSPTTPPPSAGSFFV
jgi:hypothetical protein